MTLPKYSQPRGAVYDTLPLQPPFYIQNQTAHIFPLRANMHVLQTFVDSYANIIPPELGYFRVCSPYVQVMVIDYGSLATKAANLGWLAQYETMFTVAVEWYVCVNGRLVFKDWAWVTPFIFVDSELAFTLGRTEQGWPKGLAHWLPMDAAAWMNNPRQPNPIVTVGSKVFENLYEGESQQLRPFLEVLRRPPASPLVFPANTKSPYMPWEAWGNSVSAMQGFSLDYLGFLNGLGIMPMHAGSTPQNYMRMAMRTAANLNPLQPDVYFNTLNLKQFRDASSPNDYCYQSLTNGTLRIASLRAGGLLSDMSVLAGDTSGGYTLRIHRWPSLPIIETLGLEVARQWRGDGVDVAELEPVLPFWYSVDMVYDRSTNVAWRTVDQAWHDPSGGTYPPKGGPSVIQGQYNTSLGVYTQEVTGPYAISSIARVLPLLAKKSKVQKFLDSYYNTAMNVDTPTPLGWRFDVWGPPGPCDEYVYVYLIATSYDSVTSFNENIGDWASEDLTFVVPVLLRELVGTQWVLRSSGMIPVFTYADNATAVVTMSEVQGVPTAKASFFHPPSSWMTNEPLTQQLLEVSTEVLPALNLGQKARDEVIVEIRRGEMMDDWSTDNAVLAAEQWGPMLASEVDRKWETAESDPDLFDNALALSMELFCQQIPFNVFSLKQFRDAFEPERACYQAIVKTACKIKKIHDLREAEQPMHLRIREYPSQPIVELLGLVATLANEQDGGIVYNLRPVRPFWFKMDYTQELGENLWFRSGTESWTKGAVFEPYFDACSCQAPQVGPSLVDWLDDGLGDGLELSMLEWKKQTSPTSPTMTLAEASKVIAAIEPQMVIEAMLSREWANRSADARWRVCKRDIEGDLAKLAATNFSEQRVWVAEIDYFASRSTEIVNNPKDSRHVAEARGLLQLVTEAAIKIIAVAQSPDAPEAKALFDEAVDTIYLVDPTQYEFPDDRSEAKLLRTSVLGLVGSDIRRFWDAGNSGKLVLLAQTVRASRARMRAEVVEELAKAIAQKPDFVVPRSVAGSEDEQSLMFPRRASWDEAWYVGEEDEPEDPKGEP